MDTRAKTLKKSLANMNWFLAKCLEENKFVEQFHNSGDKKHLANAYKRLHNLQLLFKTPEYKAVLIAISDFNLLIK
jgi:hypothetical protein